MNPRRPRPPLDREAEVRLLRGKIPEPGLERLRISAALVIKAKTGFYAYTFGPGGRYLLDLDRVVPDFGKKVALSMIETGNVRAADLRTVRSLPYRSTLQASRGVRLRDFGVDMQQDYLRAAAGLVKTAHFKLATFVAGADALQYRSKIDFRDLSTRADAFSKVFDDGEYKKNPDAAWIDQISLVRDKAIIAQLDALLIKEVKKGNFELSPPDTLELSRSPTFAFDADAGPDGRADVLDAKLLLKHLAKAALKTLAVDDLQETWLYGFYDGDVQRFARWRAYQCIEA